VTPAPSAAAIVDSTLRKAEDHLMHQRYWDAIQAVESVLPQAEGRARQRARVMLARALLKNPHWVRRAEETLLLAAKDEPPIVDAFLLLGALYKERNLRARALSMYRKAVELKPEHEEALAQLAELTPPPEEEPPPDKPGLLKKFFGRKP
jgi:tetratricopeptide (TPR) repeat protein